VEHSTTTYLLHVTNTTGAHSLRIWQLLSHLRHYQHFMEPEGSFPWSQKLSTARQVLSASRHGRCPRTYWISSHGQPTLGEPPDWCLGVGHTRRRNKLVTEYYRTPTAFTASSNITNYMELGPSREADGCAIPQEFSHVFWTRKFITVFTREPSTGPYPEPNESSPYHPTNLRSVLILFSHLPHSSWLSHQSPTCIPSFQHACYIPCPFYPPWLVYPN
jgi:hypothetical protein